MNSYRPTFNFFSLEGVSGITKQNVYAILKSRYNHAIMDASRLRIRSPGYVGIGVTTPNNALNISGNVVISNQSFTSLPQADFTLKSDGLQDMMTVFSHHNTVTPSMLINNAGQVIVGGQYISPSDNSKLRVYGSVISTGMALPSGQKISTEDPKIYFQLGINDNIWPYPIFIARHICFRNN